MKFQAIVTLGLIAVAAQTKDFQNQPLSPVTVYVQYNGPDTITGKCAEALASKMFAQAGVQILWRWGWSKSGEKPILIEITSDTPMTLAPGALASARAYEGVHIRIFEDRVLEAGGPKGARQLLAHAMVHEITHILERSVRHSDTGVMKARWTPHDMLAMQYKPLTFEPVDILLIHVGLAQRLLKPNAGMAPGFSTSRLPEVFH